MATERVYLEIGYDRYMAQQESLTRRWGAFGAAVNGASRGLSAAVNGGTFPFQVGFVEGQWLALQTHEKYLTYDLSTADLRYGLMPIMQRTGGGGGTRSIAMPTGKRPALAVRPTPADEWANYPLFDMTAKVIPGNQLHALADAIVASRPGNPAEDVVAALRALADDPFAQYD